MAKIIQPIGIQIEILHVVVCLLNIIERNIEI